MVVVKEMDNEKEIKEIEGTLFGNLEKLAKELWAPNLSGWRVWVLGKVGSDEISFSEPVTTGTKPNPANYSEDDWLIEMDYVTDVVDMSQEEIEAAEKETITDVLIGILGNDLSSIARKAVFPARQNCE